MNRSLRTVALVITLVLAASGINHGVFSLLQGNAPKGSLFITAIGPDHLMWEHGGEGAFTVLPTFRLTGIMAISLSIVLVVWAFAGMHRSGGTMVLLALFILLFIFGGGLAQLPFFVGVVLIASRINAPLRQPRRRGLTGIWRPALAAFVVLMLFALQTATTGFVPGIRAPDVVLVVMLAFVAASLVLEVIAAVGAAQEDAVRAFGGTAPATPTRSAS